jgi:beta-lactamase class A
VPPEATRRAAITGAAAAFAAAPALALAPDPFAELERSVGGRLGVASLDVASGRRLAHRAGERFPMCSTFKLLAVAAVLARVDRDQARLDRFIPYGPGDLLEYAPVTRAHVADGGMPLGELCKAAIELSDNTAANLILAQIGGPTGVTAFARVLGDPVTRLDRNEPSLNEAKPGDPRDTTTPAAMLADLRAVTLGGVLSPASRGRLIDWLKANDTGAARLRAGFPPAWPAGDKTGTGANGTSNDVAVAWAPHGPILVACYLTGAAAPAGARDATIAAVAQIAVRRFGGERG